MFRPHIKIYICSKKRHAEKFRDIREEYPDIYFTARWPATVNLSSEAQRPVYQWMGDNKSDILNSDEIICYAEKGDDLIGALFEVGYAHAANKHIWCVGEHKSYGEWQFYEGAVSRAPTFAKAIEGIKLKYRGAVPRIGRGHGIDTNFKVGG